jgi:hypothetical protein
MTEKEAQDWAKKEGVKIERIDGSKEVGTDVDGRYR